MLYFIIVNIRVIIKNAKIPVAGLGGVVDEFVVGNVSGDCSCGSVGGVATGRPVLGSVGIVGAGGVVVFDVDCVVTIFTIIAIFTILTMYTMFTMYNMYKLIYKNNIII